MPATSRLALEVLERRYPIRSATETPSADVAIVLGGALEPAIPPRLEPDIGDAGDRVVFAAELYRAGKVRKILVSGGNLPWKAGPGVQPEAEAIRTLLVAWGVPTEAIITEDASRTTAENARMTAEMWPLLGFSSALLVTSAAHMPRALGSFRPAGIPVTAAPSDIRSADEPIDALDFLPDAESLKHTSDAIKEVAGYAVHWLRGDI